MVVYCWRGIRAKRKTRRWVSSIWKTLCFTAMSMSCEASWRCCVRIPTWRRALLRRVGPWRSGNTASRASDSASSRPWISRYAIVRRWACWIDCACTGGLSESITYSLADSLFRPVAVLDAVFPADLQAERGHRLALLQRLWSAG